MSKAKKKEIVVHGFKGFNRDMTCRGFQFEEGKEYKHDGEAVACESGFHFCENPLDVFSYYAPGESVFCAVEGRGQIARHGGDTKVACTRLKIGLQASLHDFIGASIKFMLEREETKPLTEHATGWRSAASATVESSAASATGWRSAASATGWSSAASATGERSAASATGERSAASATGGSSAAAICTGLGGRAMAGEYGCIALAWWNKKENRQEMRCAETGVGDGSDRKLKKDTWYVVNEDGDFVEA